VRKPIGLMTHFAEADTDSARTLQQTDIFTRITAHFGGPRSLANSAAILSVPPVHHDWVRPGIMLYGASPFTGQTGQMADLLPVMSLCSRLIAVHDLRKGDRVGYGGSWAAPQDMRLGVVAAGYGDGYPRHARNDTPTLVNGTLCPLAGRVSMDMLAVDLRALPEARPGDSVLLWGKGLPVEVIAEYADTSAYELLTRITQRVHIFEKNCYPSWVARGEQGVGNAIV